MESGKSTNRKGKVSGLMEKTPVPVRLPLVAVTVTFLEIEDPGRTVIFAIESPAASMVAKPPSPESDQVELLAFEEIATARMKKVEFPCPLGE
jgi:hypothetical protein